MSEASNNSQNVEAYNSIIRALRELQKVNDERYECNTHDAIGRIFGRLDKFYYRTGANFGGHQHCCIVVVLGFLCGNHGLHSIVLSHQ